MASRGERNGSFSWAVLVWLVLAIICIQGYFFFKKKYSSVEPRPSVVKPLEVKPVKPEKSVPVKPREVKKFSEPVGRIAIVIDDWGYNNSHCKYLASMPAPVGVAILPGLPYSKDIIQCSIQNGKQPMLHLPLEPYNHKEMFQKGYVLTTDMNAATLKKTLLAVMDDMKGVVGVNNHTGSKGSESELVMTTVLSEVKKRGLFFVDSVTSEKTVGGRVASKLKMRIARRNVFLDNRNERAYIVRQMEEVANMARKNGFALAIGHDRVLTLQIIAEEMNKLSNEGFEFVTVPEYIKSNEYPRY